MPNFWDKLTHRKAPGPSPERQPTPSQGQTSEHASRPGEQKHRVAEAPQPTGQQANQGKEHRRARPNPEQLQGSQTGPSLGPTKSNVNAQAQPPNIGLKQEYPDPRDAKATGSTVIDVIALPGLSAYAPKTCIGWINGTDASSGNAYWLKDREFLPKVVPQCRILTYNWSSEYFGQHMSKARLVNEADTMLDRIDQERKKVNRDQCPIIWIASCFGGLFLAKALVRAVEANHPAKQYRRIVDLTAGMVFLGTPFRGSWEFGFANARAHIEQARSFGTPVSEEYVQYLRPDGRGDDDGRPSPLDEVVQRFTELARDKQFECPLVCFYETRESSYGARTKTLSSEFKPQGFDPVGYSVTVTQASASLDGFERVALDSKHTELWKYGHPDADGFVRISQRIKKFAQEAVKTVDEKAAHQYRHSVAPSRVIADSLTSMDFSHRQDRHFSTTRVADTGRWLLGSIQFQDWMKSPQQVMQCYGLYGTGKTILSSVVIDSLREMCSSNTSMALAYLYCETQLKHLQTLDQLMKSLLRQLLLRRRFAPEAVNALYNKHQEMSSQWSLDDVSEAFGAVARVFSRVFVIVDGLDECETSTRDQLLGQLSRHLTNSKINLFVTSRYSEDIGNQPGFSRPIQLKIDAKEQDLRRYVAETLEKAPNKKTFTTIGPNGVALKQEAVDAIVHASGSLFLLAHLYTDSLSDKLLSTDVVAALKGFRRQGASHDWSEAGTHDILSQAYDSLFKKLTDKTVAYRHLTKRVLTWLAFSPVPMTVVELKYALAVQIGKSQLEELYDEEYIKASCKGFVYIDPVTNSFRFIHSTAQEYCRFKLPPIDAQQRPPCLAPVPHCPPDSAATRHIVKELALVCATYLVRDPFKGGPCYDMSSLTHRRRSNPLFDHAAKYWKTYAEDICTDDPVSRSIFFEFLYDERCVMAAEQVLAHADYFEVDDLGDRLARNYGTASMSGHSMPFWDEISGAKWYVRIPHSVANLSTKVVRNTWRHLSCEGRPYGSITS